MPEREGYSPEDIKKWMKERTQSDAGFLSEGAEYDESGRLEVTEEQLEKVKGKMNEKFLAQDIGKYFDSEDLGYVADSLRYYEKSHRNDISKEFQERLVKLCNEFSKAKQALVQIEGKKKLGE